MSQARLNICQKHLFKKNHRNRKFALFKRLKNKIKDFHSIFINYKPRVSQDKCAFNKKDIIIFILMRMTTVSSYFDLNISSIYYSNFFGYFYVMFLFLECQIRCRNLKTNDIINKFFFALTKKIKIRKRF